LSEETARKLRAWVQAGGTLVSEGCPAYFGDRGRAGARQPNLGLDELFGARESSVEFVPDLLEGLRFAIDGLRPRGGIHRQAYEPAGGTPVGTYEDGRIAAVDHRFGKGRTRLIGTFPGAGMASRLDAATAAFFAGLMPWAGRTQHARVEDRQVTA